MRYHTLESYVINYTMPARVQIYNLVEEDITCKYKLTVANMGVFTCVSSSMTSSSSTAEAFRSSICDKRSCQKQKNSCSDMNLSNLVISHSGNLVQYVFH